MLNEVVGNRRSEAYEGWDGGGYSPFEPLACQLLERAEADIDVPLEWSSVKQLSTLAR
jgi:hypothetical protein